MKLLEVVRNLINRGLYCAKPGCKDKVGYTERRLRNARHCIPLAELGCIDIFQFVPWDQLGQLDPAVVTRELSTKWQEEVLERELITMLAELHMESSGQILGGNEPVSVHYSQ